MSPIADHRCWRANAKGDIGWLSETPSVLSAEIYTVTRVGVLYTQTYTCKETDEEGPNEERRSGAQLCERLLLPRQWWIGRQRRSLSSLACARPSVAGAVLLRSNGDIFPRFTGVVHNKMAIALFRHGCADSDSKRMSSHAARSLTPVSLHLPRSQLSIQPRPT